MARFISRGIEVNDRTLALDVIDQVGPGNHFLTHDHTVRNFRQALWFPTVIFRGNFAAWQAAGRKDMLARCTERARAVLAEHRPPPLAAAVQTRINDILAARHK
jgi:trimethylamine--corrinoid protein Co-methyltransferase